MMSLYSISTLCDDGGRPCKDFSFANWCYVQPCHQRVLEGAWKGSQFLLLVSVCLASQAPVGQAFSSIQFQQQTVSPALGSCKGTIFLHACLLYVRLLLQWAHAGHSFLLLGSWRGQLLQLLDPTVPDSQQHPGASPCAS